MNIQNRPLFNATTFIGTVHLAIAVKQPLALRIATVGVGAYNSYVNTKQTPTLNQLRASVVLSSALSGLRFINSIKSKQFKKETKVGLINLAGLLVVNSKYLFKRK